MKLVYTPHPAEGPEPKTLAADGITVIPNEPWKVEDPNWALHLVQKYPQIEGADADSRRQLEKFAKAKAEAQKGGESK